MLRASVEVSPAFEVANCNDPTTAMEERATILSFMVKVKMIDGKKLKLYFILPTVYVVQYSMHQIYSCFEQYLDL